MEFSVKLQEKFEFIPKPIYIYLIIVAAVFVLFGIAVFIMKMIPKKQVDGSAAWKALSKKEKDQIRNKYLKLLEVLYTKVVNHKLTDREIFFELSRILRGFIHAFTGVRVKNCTLEEVKKMNLPVLAGLMEEFYEVEFSQVSEGDELQAIEKTKRTIKGWNS